MKVLCIVILVSAAVATGFYVGKDFRHAQSAFPVPIMEKATDKASIVEVTENPCAWRESRSVSFLSWQGADVATVEVFGADCDSSMISLTIRDSSERVVLHEVAEFSGITPYRETRAEMLIIIEHYWESLAPRRTSELGTWLPREEMFEDRNQWTFLDKENYDRARAADAPLVCMPVHYETAHCYWRDVERNSTERIISFGA